MEVNLEADEAFGRIVSPGDGDSQDGPLRGAVGGGVDGRCIPSTLGGIECDAGTDWSFIDPERDAVSTLREFGQAYIELLCRPGGGSAIRTVMAIAERMPDVGRRFYEDVLEKTIGRLAAYLEAHVAAKDLAIPDCQLAASQFMMMCQASLFLPFIFQAAPPPSADRIAEVVASATRMFLAAYQVKAVCEDGRW